MAVAWPLGELEMAIAHRDTLARRDHVDVARLHRYPVAHLCHRHRGTLLQQLRHLALVLWREVDDDDERHALRLGQRLEEHAQRVQPASRGPEADHEQPVGGFLARRPLRTRQV